MKKKVDPTVYYNAKGYSCVIPKVNKIFCTFQCILVREVYWIIVFRIGAMLFWPATLVIVARLLKLKAFVLQLDLNVSSFSIFWGISLFSVIFTSLYNIKAILFAFAIIQVNWNCYELGNFEHVFGISYLMFAVVVFALSIVFTLKLDIPHHLSAPQSIMNLLRCVTCNVFRAEKVNRIVLKLAIWSIIALLGITFCQVSITLLTVLTDPYRNGFLCASIMLLACGVTSLFAALFSLDQIFITDYRVAINCKAGLKRCLSWLFLMTVSLSGAMFFAAIHILVLMDIRLPLRYSINFKWFFSITTSMLIPTLTIYLKRIINTLNNVVQSS